jgi:hypothetical protein
MTLPPDFLSGEYSTAVGVWQTKLAGPLRRRRHKWLEHDPEKAFPRADPMGGYRFLRKDHCSNKNIERDVRRKVIRATHRSKA